MNSLFRLLPEPFDFLDRIFMNLKDCGLDVSSYEMDHICYRVETEAQYFTSKDLLIGCGELISEKIISGRPILTFKLFQPICYKNREIYCLELPSPKLGSPYKEGWEHVEFVLDCKLEEFLEKHPKVKFDQKGMAKKVNADLRIQFQEGSVKFHEQSLEYVILYLD